MSSLLISPTEAQLLAALIECPLDAVVYDGWAVYLRSGDLRLQFYPEEIHTPTSEHTHACINRPAIGYLHGELPPPARTEWAVHTLGAVANVLLLHTIVSWSPRREVGPAVFPNAELPAGIEYGPIFARPGAAARRDSGSFPSDLGVLLETVEGHRRLIYTEAAGHFVLMALTGAAPHHATLMPEWRSPADLMTRSDTMPLAARL